MTSLMISTIVFVALLTLFLAIGLALRDMKLAEINAKPGALSLSRPFTAVDHTAPSSTIGRINFSFDRFVLESGTGVVPFAAFLLMVLSGLVSGGVILLLGEGVVTALLTAVFGMLFPLVVLSFIRRGRLKQIEEQMPEVLALLSRAVHAGETMEQAVALAGADTPAPMGPELQMCAQQMALGVSVSRSMESLGRRVCVSDVHVLSSVLAVHRHSGGNLASTLGHLSEVVRDRSSHRRQLRAATAAGRLSAQFVGIAGPLLFVTLFFFKREHIAPLLEMPIGNALLLAAAVLELVGLMWLVYMLRD